MRVNPAEALGSLGKVYRMPGDIAGEVDAVKRAWAIGVFSGATGEDEVEVKIISVEDVEKTYEKLELHGSSPQIYAVLSGSVAVPAASELDDKVVEFYEVREGEAILVNAKVWHGGAVGIDVPAKVVVVLKKGTGEGDTKKMPLSSSVTFTKCGGGAIR
ncbi:MAG TPA: hypothetical protein GX506_04165 [Firmicutes bacterium]|nr:hypothetical protein [Bacillota bacterium]